LALGTNQNILYALPFYYQEGLKDFSDVMAIHYYPEYDFQSYDNEGTGLRQLITQVRAIMANYGDSSKPIWNTEGGLNSGETSDFIQAIYLVRFYIIQMAKGIEKIFWFWSIVK